MAITKAQVRARLKSAKSAAEKLEADVRWLVSNRAWDVMGYENFAAMWKGENGEEPSALLKYMATYSFMDVFGLNDAGQGRRPNGPSTDEIADEIGYARSKEVAGSNSVRRIADQYMDGVPVRQVSGKYSRKRSQPRRMGKLPSELVNCGWSVYKYQADAVKEVARKAGVPDSVVVRSALDAYLQGKIGKVS